MAPRSSFLNTLIILASGIAYARAQDAVCLSDPAHQWGYNSRGQSPCDVAGSLLSVCLGRTVTIVALDPGRIYSGSQASGEGNDCRCSSVYYATLAACAQCQGRNWGTWADQIANCNGDISVMTIPISIPSGTTVPPWAYLDYPSAGTFDVDLARSGGSSSSSSSSSTSSSPPSTVTSIIRQTSTIISTGPGSTSGPTTPGGNGNNGGNGGNGNTGGNGGNGNTGGTGNTGGNTGGTGGNTGGTSGNSNGGGNGDLISGSSEKKTPVGAIVGGVVGGLAAIGLIAGLIAFVIVRGRRNNETRPTSMYSEKPNTGMGSTSPFMAPTQTTLNTGMSQPGSYVPPVNPAMTGGSQYYNQPTPQMYTPGQQPGFNQQSPFATPPQSAMGIPAQDGSQYGAGAGGAQQPGAYRGVPEV